MGVDKMTDFVFNNINYSTKPGSFRTEAVALLILAAACFSKGASAGGKSETISFYLLFSTLAFAVLIMLSTAFFLTPRRYFIGRILGTFGWLNIFISLDAILLYGTFGIGTNILPFLILPVISALVFLDLSLKKAEYRPSSLKTDLVKYSIYLGIACAFVGKFIAKNLIGKLNAKASTVVILACSLLVSCVFSADLVNIPKLICLGKLKRQGVDINKYDLFGQK